MELTLRLVTTLATTVPTFFIRLKPTSSIAKPACMNMTKHAATMTQTVSAATPAAWVAVVSSAKAETGTRADTTAMPAARPNAFRRLADGPGWSKVVLVKRVPSKLYGGQPR